MVGKGLNMKNSDAVKFFAFIYDEYEWCGRTEYKKRVVCANINLDRVVTMAREVKDLNFRFMDELDDSFE